MFWYIVINGYVVSDEGKQVLMLTFLKAVTFSAWNNINQQICLKSCKFILDIII